MTVMPERSSQVEPLPLRLVLRPPQSLLGAASLMCPRTHLPTAQGHLFPGSLWVPADTVSSLVLYPLAVSSNVDSLRQDTSG